MRSSVLGRSRARVRARTLSVGACVALGAGLAGCAAAGSSSVKATGKTLVIYASTPPGASANASVQDVLDAERLAFQQKSSEVTAYQVSFAPTLSTGKLSDHARTAIQNESAIAYLGEILPGDSADTIGINNAQDLLQVAPTDTALELTASTPALSNTPGRYYESLKTYGRTFARVVPNSEVEAKAQVQEMQSLGVSKLYITDDGSTYGKAVADAVKQNASPAITVVPSQSGADAMFYGASSDSAAIKTFNSAAQSNPKLELFAPSALADPTFAAGITTGARNVFISEPGYLPADLSAAGQKFVSDFRAAYQRSPTPQAIFGYESMLAVLNVLKKAGASANDRGTVVSDFLSYNNANELTVLPPYKVNANGDTSLTPFVFNHLRNGKLVPFKFVQPQG